MFLLKGVRPFPHQRRIVKEFVVMTREELVKQKAQEFASGDTIKEAFSDLVSKMKRL